MKHTPFAGFDCARTRAAIDAGHVEWAWLPATRAAAKAAGVTHYFTGKACKHGHVGNRSIYAGCAYCDSARRAETAFKKKQREHNRKHQRNKQK